MLNVRLLAYLIISLIAGCTDNPGAKDKQECSPGEIGALGMRGPCDDECSIQARSGVARCIDGRWGPCECSYYGSDDGMAAPGGRGSKSTQQPGRAKPSTMGRAGNGSAPQSSMMSASESVSKATGSKSCSTPSKQNQQLANDLCQDSDYIKLDDGTALLCKRNERFGSIWQLTIDTQKFDHQDATDYCSQLELAGRTWRLPCISELEDLGYYKEYTFYSTLPPKTESYWSSTPSSTSTNQFAAMGYGGTVTKGVDRESGALYRARCIAED